MLRCGCCGGRERVRRFDRVRLCHSCTRVPDLLLVLELRQKVRTGDGSTIIIPYSPEAQIKIMQEVRRQWQENIERTNAPNASTRT